MGNAQSTYLLKDHPLASSFSNVSSVDRRFCFTPRIGNGDRRYLGEGVSGLPPGDGWCEGHVLCQDFRRPAGGHLDVGEDMLEIGGRIREYHTQQAGPFAIVLAPDKFGIAARVLGMLAMARRPMRIFGDMDEARRWLRSVAPGLQA